MLTNKEISNIQITWKTLSFPEIKSRLQELYHSDMSFLDLVSALYWDLIETKHKYYRESVKFGNNRATLKEMTELREAKQLLKMAVEDLSKMPCNNDTHSPGSCYICVKHGNCSYTDSFKWCKADIALKLIGETNDEP